MLVAKESSLIENDNGEEHMNMQQETQKVTSNHLYGC